MLIGLCGEKGSGKDTVTRYLVSDYGFVQESLAAPMKKALAAMFDVPLDVFDDPKRKEKPLECLHWLTPRHLIQTLGTEWGRNIISQFIWIRILQHRIEELESLGLNNIVVSDVRFDSEAITINCIGGEVWEITRGEKTYSPEDPHLSEAGIDRKHIRRTIANNGTMLDLFAGVDVAMGKDPRSFVQTGPCK